MRCFQSNPIDCASLIVRVFISDVADEHLRGVVPPLEMAACERHETRTYFQGRVIDVLFGDVADALVFDTGLVSSQKDVLETHGWDLQDMIETLMSTP